MTVIDAVFQGLIQGATEFLPVSSSGHLSLFQHFFGVSGEEAVFSTITLHLGTLIAVFIAFRQKIGRLICEFFRLVKDVFSGRFKWKEMNSDRRMILMIIISILPLFIFYIFKDFFTGVSSDNDIIVEGICFLYTAAILFIGDKRSKSGEGIKKTCGEVTVRDALFIGFFQGVALLPGVSRSGSTISGGLISGMKREDAVEYSFILGIPVILAGALSECLDLFGSSGSEMTVEAVPIIVGMIVAAAAGYFAIRLISWLMKSDRFGIFSVYTFILGIIVLGAGIYEHISGSIICFA